MSNRERVIEVLRRLGEFDFDGVAEMLAPEFVQEYPYRPMPESPDRIVGVDEFLAFCKPGMTAFEPYRFQVIELYETTDPSVIVCEYSSHSRLLATGAPYGNRYVGIFEFDDDGLITRWREYLNPEVISRTFGG